MKRDPLSNAPLDSAGFSGSSSSSSNPSSGSNRRKASRKSSDAAWNWALFLALLATIYYFWIYPIQSPRKPLRVIFENGPQSPKSVATETAAPQPNATEPAAEPPPADRGTTEPESDLKPSR